jgi:hypothetical protein
MKFEYIDHDTIETSEGDIIPASIYKLYVQEARANPYGEIKCIPGPFFEFLHKAASIRDIEFDPARWDTEISPRLTPTMREALFTFQKEAVFKMITHKRCLNAASMGL